jgi:hypothetical protein
MDLDEQNRILRLGNDLLRAALKECCDDLEARIRGAYAGTLDHPAMKQRFDRDMGLVSMARRLIPEDDIPLPRVRVQGGDYVYEGWLDAIFPKRSGAVRVVVEDENGRLFVHNTKQIERLP